MKNEFEFDKIVLSIALAIFVFIFSQNLGGLLYNSNHMVDPRGYQIEVTGASAAEPVKGVPEVVDMGAILASADPEAGKAIFSKCAVCHTQDKNGPNKVGPNLWNIVNKKTAIHEGFTYSNAMLKRGQDGGSWGYEELYRYLYAPAQYVVGTKMAFAGIKNDKDRANLIAYLHTLSDNPIPLPKANAPSKP